MASPIIPLVILGTGGLAVWRGFREDRKHRPSAKNGWRNEAFSNRENSGKGKKQR